MLGMAFAAFRDIGAFLRREKGPANPLAAGQRGTVDQAVLTGVSQSGRFVRDYLYLGFNEDERGRQVFDAHAAAYRRARGGPSPMPASPSPAATRPRMATGTTRPTSSPSPMRPPRTT